MIHLYIQILCDRCSLHESWLDLLAAENVGWQFNQESGECLCPVCVWEEQGKKPPRRKLREEEDNERKRKGWFYRTREDRAAESKHLIKNLKESGILYLGEPCLYNANLHSTPNKMPKTPTKNKNHAK